MNPADFPQSNVRLTAPDGMTDCLEIKAFGFDADPDAGIPASGFLTRWIPTADERARLAAGGDVWVFVYVTGGGPPPMAISGLHPFEEHPENPRPPVNTLRTYIEKLEEKLEAKGTAVQRPPTVDAMLGQLDMEQARGGN